MSDLSHASSRNMYRWHADCARESRYIHPSTQRAELFTVRASPYRTHSRSAQLTATALGPAGTNKVPSPYPPGAPLGGSSILSVSHAHHERTGSVRSWFHRTHSRSAQLPVSPTGPAGANKVPNPYPLNVPLGGARSSQCPTPIPSAPARCALGFIAPIRAKSHFTPP